MKKILILTMLVLSVKMIAQENKINYAQRKDGVLTLTNVEQVAEVSANELYKRALLWVSDIYKNPKAVIQTQDADAGILVIKGSIQGAAKTDIQHKLMFQFKDGRYKWDISEGYTIFPAMFNMPNKSFESTPRYNKESEDISLNNLMKDFSDYIQSFQKRISQGDNW